MKRHMTKNIVKTNDFNFFVPNQNKNQSCLFDIKSLALN